MRQIDDYELIDQDYEEFIRRGLEELEWERCNVITCEEENKKTFKGRQ